MSIYDDIRTELEKPDGEIQDVATTSVKYATWPPLASHVVALAPLKALSYKYHALIFAGINPHSGVIYLYRKPCDSLQELEYALGSL